MTEIIIATLVGVAFVLLAVVTFLASAEPQEPRDDD
jgi:hypothetical protein